MPLVPFHRVDAWKGRAEGPSGWAGTSLHSVIWRNRHHRWDEITCCSAGRGLHASSNAALYCALDQHNPLFCHCEGFYFVFLKILSFLVLIVTRETQAVRGTGDSSDQGAIFLPLLMYFFFFHPHALTQLFCPLCQPFPVLLGNKACKEENDSNSSSCRVCVQAYRIPELCLAFSRQKVGCCRICEFGQGYMKLPLLRGCLAACGFS